MSFPSAVRVCLRKYADVAGRARPAEFWWFVLFVLLTYAVGRGLDAALGIEWHGYGPFGSATLLIQLLPLLAAGARRLHDTDVSAWWLLLYLVPCGGIALLVYFVKESGADNRFGPSPMRPTGPSPVLPG